MLVLAMEFSRIRPVIAWARWAREPHPTSVIAGVGQWPAFGRRA
jgi:hypothetical protein